MSGRAHGLTWLVLASRAGRVIELRGKVVVLSAGALHSPQVLLRSVNEHWPKGLANGSGQVGRNLMFHTADIYALFAPRRLDRKGRQKKAISVRDFRFGERNLDKALDFSAVLRP